MTDFSNAGDCPCPTCEAYRAKRDEAPEPVLETLPCTCALFTGGKFPDPNCPRFLAEERRDKRRRIAAEAAEAKDRARALLTTALPEPLRPADIEAILDAPRLTQEAAPSAGEREARKTETWPGGRKDDAGKAPLDLLSSLWLFGVAQVLGFGAKKYAAHNWRKGILQSRLIAAALRHLIAFNGGEDLDPETQLCHLLHASCCLMFAFEMFKTRPDMDDRYKPATGPRSNDNG